MNTPYENLSEKQSCIEVDDINILQQKVLSQKGIMEEYRNWLKMLLNILNNNEDFSYHAPIKKGIDKIEHLFKFNMTIKRAYYKENTRFEEISKKVSQLNDQFMNIKETIKNNPSGRLLIEKINLLDSLESISKEIDFYTESNQTYKVIYDTINKKELISQLKDRIKELKQSNLILKNSIVNNEKFVDEKVTKGNFGSNILSCFTVNNDSENTLFLNK